MVRQTGSSVCCVPKRCQQPEAFRASCAVRIPGWCTLHSAPGPRTANGAIPFFPQSRFRKQRQCWERAVLDQNLVALRGGRIEAHHEQVEVDGQPAAIGAPLFGVDCKRFCASRQFPPKIHDQYKAMLGSDCPWNEMERWSFYDEIKSPEESSRRC